MGVHADEGGFGVAACARAVVGGRAVECGAASVLGLPRTADIKYAGGALAHLPMLLEPHVERVLRHFRSVPGRGPSSADGSHFACAVRFDDGVSKSFEYFRRDGRDIRRTSGPLIAASLRVAPEGDELLAFSQYFQALAVLKEVSALEDLLALSQTHGGQPAGGVCARAPGRLLADQVAEDLVDSLGDLGIVDIAVDGDHVLQPDRYAEILILAPLSDLLWRRDVGGPAGEPDGLPVAVLPARHLAERLEG